MIKNCSSFKVYLKFWTKIKKDKIKTIAIAMFFPSAQRRQPGFLSSVFTIYQLIKELSTPYL